MAGGCGELTAKKSKCSEKSKSKSNCPEKSKSKSNCPDKSQSTSNCPDSGSKTGKDAFGRQICRKEKEEPECHESRKKFFEKSDKKCGEKTKKADKKCGEKIKKADKKCGGKTKKAEDKCDEKTKKADNKCCGQTKKDVKKCPEVKNKQENQCGERKEETKCEDKKAKEQYKCKGTASCGNTNCCERMVGTKKKKSCQDLGKEYVDHGPKTKPPLSDVEANLWKMPEPKVMAMRPCLPRVERSIAAKRGKGANVRCITTNFSCPQLPKPNMAEFFCIDARNMKMNECIKQYMKSDPNQVNFQCSQFARKRMHTASQLAPAAAGFLPAKYRQIMGRWWPTAGLYVMAGAALGAWVTEWGEVVNRIPFYRTKEEVPADAAKAKAPSEPEEPSEAPAAESTSDS